MFFCSFAHASVIKLNQMLLRLKGELTFSHYHKKDFAISPGALPASITSPLPKIAALRMRRSHTSQNNALPLLLGK